MPAPAMMYVVPDNFTPAHRAQLVRSNKKLEQILGVTPSLLPISSAAHRRTRSAVPSSSTTSATTLTSSPSLSITTPSSPRRAGARDRGKLVGLFKDENLYAYSSTTRERRESQLPLRSSIDSTLSGTTATSSSTHEDALMTQSSPDLPLHRDATPKRLRRRNRPPMLNLSGSGDASPSSGSAQTSEASSASGVLDISPLSSAALHGVSVDSPMSPLFRVELPGVKKEGNEEEDVLSDIGNYNTYRPIDKRTKLSRLAKHFGTQPPLELVFPPSPTSQSRKDPKRYTLGLPPPMCRGVEVESRLDKEEQENDIQVYWDSVEDVKGREQVMEKLRCLRV